MKRRSLLSQVTEAPLSKPCAVPWDTMRGGERLRHCDACDKPVWNLSAMTALEAEIRLLNAPELPCINYRVDGDGVLITRRELSPARRGLGAAAFVATTLLAPGPVNSGSLGGAVASAADKDAPKPDDQSTKSAKPKPNTAQKPDKKPLTKDDCPTAAPIAGTTALDPPQRLGGAPPATVENPPYGNVTFKTTQPRNVAVNDMGFSAPGTMRLPPGKYEAVFSDGKKKIKRSFTVVSSGNQVIDLDR